MDLTTGLARYQVDNFNPQHWDVDERFDYFNRDQEIDLATPSRSDDPTGAHSLIREAKCLEDIVCTIRSALCFHMDAILQLPAGNVRSDSSTAALGVDSMVVMDIRR